MGTEREIDALASEAIAASEREFFNAAVGKEDTDTDDSPGDRSLEEMGSGLEGQHEADDAEDGEQAADAKDKPDAKAEGEDKGDGKDGATDRDGQGRFKPKGEGQPQGKTETPAERGLRSELVAQREKTRTAETEFSAYRAEMEKRFAVLEARLAQTAPQPAAVPKPEDKKDDVPDRWTDPDGYDRYQREQILNVYRQEREQEQHQRAAESFQDAKAKHGDAFIEAFKAADALPADQATPLLHSIRTARDPGERLMAWHRQMQAQREIGGDPAAYKAKLEADLRESLLKDPEVRKQILADMRGEAATNIGDGPRSATKLPPSLSTAQGGGPTRANAGGTSDAELFEDLWAR